MFQSFSHYNEDHYSRYNKDNSLNQLMKNQNKWAWFIGFFKNEKNTLTDLIQISDENLTNGIASMEHAKEENQIAPTDAYIQYKDGSFSIIEETLGSKFNIEELVLQKQMVMLNLKFTKMIKI